MNEKILLMGEDFPLGKVNFSESANSDDVFLGRRSTFLELREHLLKEMNFMPKTREVQLFCT